MKCGNQGRYIGGALIWQVIAICLLPDALSGRAVLKGRRSL